MLLLEIGLKDANIQKYEVTFTLAILRTLLTIAYETFRDAFSEEDFSKLKTSGMTVSDGVRLPSDFIAEMRHAVAHMLITSEAHESRIASIDFATRRGFIARLRPSDLIDLTRHLGARILAASGGQSLATAGI